MATEGVRLVTPASALYVHLARLMAAALAADAGCSYDEVEDLRIAVGEAAALILRHVRGDAELDFRFQVGDVVEVEVSAVGGTRRAGALDPDDPELKLSCQIIEAMVDEFLYEPVGPRVVLSSSLPRVTA